ncbi:hypothetical protein BGZ46_007973 [Entomortierella lignicola]|nr:hypothetical protein BGZ46_007973 [Entomortierella lignicola]
MSELIKHGASLNILDQYGWSSLMLAAYAGKFDACKLLLSHGADPLIRTANGKDAGSLSRDAGHESISDYISIFLARPNNASSSSSAPGSVRSSRTLITQMLPQAPRSPSRKTHSPAPSLPSVPEEVLEEGHHGTQHSISVRNSTISRQSVHSPRISQRRPHPIVINSISPSRLEEEEPVSPIPTALASSRLATIFKESEIISNLEDGFRNDAPSASASASASLARERSRSIPTILPSEVPTSNNLGGSKPMQQIKALSTTKPTQTYRLVRQGIIPKYGSRELYFSPEDQPETAESQLHFQGQPCSSSVECKKVQNMEDSLNRRASSRQRLTDQSRNRIWVVLSMIFTCCCPTKMFPKSWTKDRRQDWREKVALSVLIAGLSLAFGSLTIGLPLATCRSRSIQSISLSEFSSLYGNSSHGVDTSRLMAIRGSVYDVGTIFLDGRHPLIAGNQSLLSSFVDAHFGSDVSSLFLPMDPTDNCELFGSATNFGRCSPPGSNGINYCHPAQTSQYLLQDIFQKDIRIAFHWSDIVKMNTQGRSLFIYDGSVFDVTDYLAQPVNISLTIAESTRMDWIRTLVGRDATQIVWRQSDWKSLSSCFQRVFKVGVLSGQTNGCLTSIVINIFILGILVIIVTMRMVSALVYYWMFPELKLGHGKGSFELTSGARGGSRSHILMLVTCRANDTEEQIKATLEALALADYDDNRKLLLVITDATVDSSGNLSQASLSCLSFMAPHSIEKQEDQRANSNLNSVFGIQGGKDKLVADDAKIHSGYYVADSRRIPYILLLRPSRQISRLSDSTWQKKKFVIRWLHRVCFDKPMSALEFVLFEKVRDYYHHGPGIFDLLLVSKIGTVCDHWSVARMADALEHDERVIGVSGHRLIENSTQNWVTRIQDYESHLSLQFSSTFESTFGTIQCLPSHFSLVRIKVKQLVKNQDSKKKTKSQSHDASIISSSDDDGDNSDDHSGYDIAPSGSANLGDNGSGKVAKRRKLADSEVAISFIPILVHPEVVSSFAGRKTRTLHEHNVVQDEGEDRYLTGLLHKTFSSRRIVYLPQATYRLSVTSSFWAYIEEQSRIQISSLHNLWIQLWSKDLRGIFCCSINFLILLEWMYIALLPAIAMMTWVALVIVVVGAVVDVGALYSLPTLLTLVLSLSIMALLPIVGVCLGRRKLGSNMIGLSLLLTTFSFRFLAIAIYMYRLPDDKYSMTDDTKDLEPPNTIPLQEVITRSDNQRTLRYWAEWGFMLRRKPVSAAHQEKTREQQGIN